MNVQTESKMINKLGPTRVQGSLLQRACACGQHSGNGGECEECKKKRQGTLQRAALGNLPTHEIPPIVHDVLNSPGQRLDKQTRAFMEPRFGHDFSDIHIHTDAKAAKSARAVNALAYTVGQNVVFGENQYMPQTVEGRRLLAHELTHTLQQSSLYRSSLSSDKVDDSREAEHNAESIADAVITNKALPPVQKSTGMVQRRAAPYIKKVTVHLTPPQSADLEWEGTPPVDATGSDHFTVSTGKGYADPGDPPGTCTRQCCSDPLTQCAPPWNQPGRVGACCTYYGNNFWTGTPLHDHNGWQWWTPIQPYYSSRGIALHQHPEVTGEPIGHGCVRMDEPNAKRIYDFSNGRRTNVTIDGRAAPVACEPDRQCEPGSRGAQLHQEVSENLMAALPQEAIAGLEGVMS
jgi:hypothetical protein